MPITIRDNISGAVKQIASWSDSKMIDFAARITAHAKDQPEMGGAPVLTGNLSRSIKMVKSDNNTLRVQTETGYGGYVNFGTSRMAANPFMQRALDKAVNDFQKEGEWK